MSIVSRGTKGGSVLVTIAVGGVLAIPVATEAQSRERQTCSRINPGNSAYCCPNVSPYRSATRLRPGFAEFCAYGFIESFNAWDQSSCLFTRRYACVATVRATSHGSEANGTLLIHLCFRRRAGSLVPVLV